MTTLRGKLIKVCAKVVYHARHMVFQIVEVAIPRPLFAAIPRRIEHLRCLARARHDRDHLGHQGIRPPPSNRSTVAW